VEGVVEAVEAWATPMLAVAVTASAAAHPARCLKRIGRGC
jgi:hypothetical protein